MDEREIDKILPGVKIAGQNAKEGVQLKSYSDQVMKG